MGQPGAMTTRATAHQLAVGGMKPLLQQEAVNPISYSVTRGALVLGFELLFLRPLDVGEHDIIISVVMLEAFAAYVWRFV